MVTFWLVILGRLFIDVQPTRGIYTTAYYMHCWTLPATISSETILPAVNGENIATIFLRSILYSLRERRTDLLPLLLF